MDMRVGKITKVWKHPDSVHLYCEEIDIGGGEIRNVASGLQDRIPIEKMDGALCVVLVNLKARKLAGFESHGMVLCGSDESDKIEIITPPKGSQPGDLISIEGEDRDPPV